MPEWALLAAFGLIARVYQRDMVTDGGTLRFRIATFIDVTGQKALALLAGAFLLLVAVILTASRGGIIATGLGCNCVGCVDISAIPKGFD